MEEPGIILTREPYDDSAWRIRLEASNGEFAAALVFYIDGASLLEFARRLSAFPKSIQDEVCFRLGSREGSWAYYLSLRAYVCNRAGHTALDVEIDNREPGYCHARAAFAMAAETASLNELGRKLAGWVERPGDPLVWRARSS